jgi:putative heme-binding domain-containing protein
LMIGHLKAEAFPFDGSVMFRRLVLASALLLVPVASKADAASDAAQRLETLSKLVQDTHPRVRLEALRALAKIPGARSAELALSVLEQPMDPTLDYALWLTINELSEPWIAALESGAWKSEGREKQLAFALKAIRAEQASRVLGRVIQERRLPRDGSGPWIELIGQAGGPKELGALLRQTVSGGFDDAATARALTSLGEAARTRKVRPEGDATGILGLLESSNDSVRAATLRLTGDWKTPPPTQSLTRLANDPSEQVRTTVFEVLRLQGGGSLPLLRQLAEDKDPATRRRAVLTWAALDLGGAGAAVVSAVQGLDQEQIAQEFWRSLLAIKGSGKQLAALLPASGIPAAAARTGMRVAREGGRNDMELVLTLAKGAGLSADTQAFTDQLIREMATRAAASGNPQRGELVYRRSDLACITCHAIGGAGGRVGPDMTSIGASAQPDYLVESLLMPNAKIKEGYHGVVVETKDGQTLSGTVVRESASELVLRGTANQEIVLAKSNLESRNQASASLMPAGLLDSLNEAEQLDLVAFLSQLGKPGEFDASKGGVARKWRLANIVHTDQQNGQSDWMWKKPLEDKRWTEVLSRVNGDLTRTLMEGATKANIWSSKIAVLAVTEIQLAQPGTVRFQLTAAQGAELWVDGSKVNGPVALPAGTHRVLVRIDPNHIPDKIRLETKDASFVLN